MKPYFCAAQLFLVRPDEVDQKAVALSAVAGRDLVERETAAGVLAVGADGEGESEKVAIEDAISSSSMGGIPVGWKVINKTEKNRYIFIDVLVW